MYTLSALCIATGLTEHLGPKWTLCIGVFAYCFYISSFLIATQTEGSTQWAAVLLG